jgi:hypothetical protein
MATTGLEVFDRTLHPTNLWLDEICAEIGPDKHLAWHVLGAVLRSIRDELLIGQSAHLRCSPAWRTVPSSWDRQEPN